MKSANELPGSSALASSSAITQEESQSYGLGDPLMLERIDKLIACGIGNLIDLPQIVVIGDQSSGKSSVLAGLIRKDLPRDSGLCTRFATHIIFRRAEEVKITASIIAGPDASDEHRSEVEAWKRDHISSLGDDMFSIIMSEARAMMGLRSSGNLSGSNFSNDIFQLEISGPEQEHLSVIDVPGIFKNTTQGVTTKADIEMVKAMVLKYMENPRSIMLAVIPANVDVATQEILELARDVDKDGDRTLGVLTKPDLVDKGAEGKVVELMEGEDGKMKLGWHIVRNPGQQQLSDTSIDRDSLEMDFFRSTSPWRDLDKDKVGIENLRRRLNEVLSTLVRREFPKVKQEIKKRLTEKQKSLNNIGPERSTSHSQCAFLTDLATKFQRLVMLSLNAKYGTDEAFEKHKSLRIAPAVTERYTIFSRTMACNGHTYAFLKQSPSQNIKEGTEDPEIDTDQEMTHGADNKMSRSRLEAGDEAIILDDLLEAGTKLTAVDQDGIEPWLRKIYKTNRGFELGTFDSAILATTMKKQSAKWCDIGLGFISDVIAIVHRFIRTALKVLCHDTRLKDAILSSISEDLMERYRKAINEVRFLLEVERNGTPMTVNHYFNDNLEKCRQARMCAAMAQHTFHSQQGLAIRLSDAKLTHPMSNSQHMLRDIHDTLHSYYKLTRKRFVDNVLKQAMDHFLISGPDTPMAFFSPNYVNSLDSAELEHIAGERPDSKRIRARLNKEIACLTDAKNILARG